MYVTAALTSTISFKNKIKQKYVRNSIDQFTETTTQDAFAIILASEHPDLELIGVRFRQPSKGPLWCNF